jgi:hypothetical protein
MSLENTAGTYETSGNITSTFADATAAAVDSQMTFTVSDNSANVDAMLLDHNGRVGIGQATPNTKLDVNGTIRMGYSAEPCDASRLGGLYYDSVGAKFYGCVTAGSWTQIATGTGAATPAGSDKQLQLNNNGVLYASSGLTFNSTTGVLATYMGTFDATSPSASTNAIYAQNESANGTVIYALSNTTTGPVNTIYAQNNSSGGGSAGWFNAAATSGGGAGLYVTNASTGGYGMELHENATTGSTYGVYATTISPAGTAISGKNLATSGTTAAVSGITFSSTDYAMGVYGGDAGGAGLTVGVWGLSSSTGTGRGVMGEQNGAGNNGVGIYGSNNGASNTGYGGYFSNSSATGWNLYAAGTSPSYINASLGIGTTIPKAALDVNGAIKLADGGKSCSAANSLTGAIRYNSSTNKVQSCNGTTWADVGSGVTVTPAGSNGYIQFNSSGTALGGDSKLFWDDANKRLGIGTVSPSSPVDIQSAVTPLNLVNTGATGYSALISGLAPNLTTTQRAQLVLGRDNSYANSISFDYYYSGANSTSNRLDFNFYSASVPALSLLAGGNVGINTTAPVTKLDVNGTIRMGYSGETCDAAHEGSIYYNSATDLFMACKTAASGWVNISSATPAGSDKQLQLNNNGVLYASAGLTYNSTSGLLTNANRISVGGSGKDTNSVMITGGNATSTADQNTAIGAGAGASLSSGAYNTMMGAFAGTVLATGSYNTLIGQSAGANTAGDRNTMVGNNAGNGATGSYNSFFGQEAGKLSTGGDNIYMGYLTGNTASTGSSNIMIGDQLQLPSSGTSNYLSIGNLIYGVLPTGTVYTKIGIGTSSPVVKLDINGTIRMGYSGEACDAAHEGSIYYNSATDLFMACKTAASGWVNISSAAPAGSDKQLQWNDNGVLAASSGLNFISSSGNFGIGTASPQTKLHVAQTAAASTAEELARFSLSDDTNSYLKIMNGTASDANFAATLEGYYNGSGNPGLEFRASGETDTGTVPVMQFNARISAASASVTRPLYQWRENGTPVMTIDAADNLGIGTTTPKASLDTFGAIKLADGNQSCSAANGLTGAIRYNSSTNKLQSCNGTAWADVASGGTVTPAGSNGYIQFNSSGTALGGDSKMFWDDSNKRLGVGTTTPGAPLDVQGAYDSNGAVARLYSTNTLGADVGGGISMGGTYSGAATTEFGIIRGLKNNVTSGDYGGYMQFLTRPNGVTAPKALLDVNGAIKLADGSAVCSAANSLTGAILCSRISSEIWIITTLDCREDSPWRRRDCRCS